MTRPKVLSLSLLGIVTATLFGCMAYNLRTHAAIDLSNKTVTVPQGGGLTGAVKNVLARDGWKVTVYRGPEVTLETTGDTTNLERSRTFTTRYTVFLRWQHVDRCVPWLDPEYIYDISFVDNQGGTDVFTLSGRGCENRIVDAFITGLRSPPR